MFVDLTPESKAQNVCCDQFSSTKVTNSKNNIAPKMCRFRLSSKLHCKIVYSLKNGMINGIHDSSFKTLIKINIKRLKYWQPVY